jgi:CPA2 family monovalent cation:H+ antiporter-2
MRQVALGGALQVGLTTGVATASRGARGSLSRGAIFYGFVFALSSTAIVLRAWPSGESSTRPTAGSSWGR